jgi:glycosyltransferase involved in cell wall biosynthesis
LGLLAREPFASRLRQLSAEADVVHFVEAEAAGGLGLVSKPAVVQLHCLTMRDGRSWSPIRAAGRESIELLRAEIKIRRRARWLLANSPEVGNDIALRERGATVMVAPLALDPTYYAPAATLGSNVAGLIGTATWPPTASAVERLIGKVWPLVRELYPQARLVLAGHGMERSRFKHLPDCPSIEWRGTVPSASDFLRELGVLLYPLAAGSGAKIKVLEALALGVPVVTTPNGAEGLGSSKGVVIETEDRSLAAATITLLKDAQARGLAGKAASETFRDYHTPELAAVPVIELYERMVGELGVGVRRARSR